MPVTHDGFSYEIEDNGVHYWVRFRYNPDLVERIKSLPKGTRWWDADERAWGVEYDWIDEAERVLAGAPRRSQSETRQSPPDDPYLRIARSLTADHVELGILPDVPWEIVESVHRRWAALVHPDLGGDPETMKKKNVARDNLRKQYGK